MRIRSVEELSFEMPALDSLYGGYFTLLTLLVTAKLSPAPNQHQINCEGKLLDNGTHASICLLENNGKTLDFLFGKCQKMRE